MNVNLSAQQRGLGARRHQLGKQSGMWLGFGPTQSAGTTGLAQPRNGPSQPPYPYIQHTVRFNNSNDTAESKAKAHVQVQGLVGIFRRVTSLGVGFDGSGMLNST